LISSGVTESLQFKNATIFEALIRAIAALGEAQYEINSHNLFNQCFSG